MPSNVREVALSKLKYAERNPRRIRDVRLEQLKRSLEADREMLSARPLVALPDGTVLMGNMRLRALPHRDPRRRLDVPPGPRLG